MANSVDPDQTAPIGAVCSGSTLFASILNLSVMLGNYLQQTTSADDIFRCIFFLGALRVKNNAVTQNLFDQKKKNERAEQGRLRRACKDLPGPSLLPYAKYECK